MVVSNEPDILACLTGLQVLPCSEVQKTYERKNNTYVVLNIAKEIKYTRRLGEMLLGPTAISAPTRHNWRQYVLPHKQTGLMDVHHCRQFPLERLRSWREIVMGNFRRRVAVSRNSSVIIRCSSRTSKR
jgi:hypothetical protein